MPLPSSIALPAYDAETKEDDPLMWMYYLAQIALRKLLNRAHTTLYNKGWYFTPETRLESLLILYRQGTIRFSSLAGDRKRTGLSTWTVEIASARPAPMGWNRSSVKWHQRRTATRQIFWCALHNSSTVYISCDTRMRGCRRYCIFVTFPCKRCVSTGIARRNHTESQFER